VPLRDDLLNPIAGENPSGASLRYDRLYDQIKEARTEDDESLPSGAWQRQVKKADSQLVIKLAGEALATRSKDLQLVAWLSEALIRREGIAALESCLQLFLQIQAQFWDTIYPEIDDGDIGMRATPIEWAANRIAALLREAPLTRSGLNFFQYKDSRAIGYEADVQSDDVKREAREVAIQDGKVSAESFDSAFAVTAKSIYVGLDASLTGSMQALDALQLFCEDKFGDDGPALNKLRTAIEEVHHVVSALLTEKRKLEPDAVPADSEPVEDVGETAEPELEEIPAETTPPVAAAPLKKQKTLSSEPVDWDDALARIHSCARYLEAQNPGSPVPYMVQTAVRWGELREQGSSASYDFLASPSTEVRQNIKKLSAESAWAELLAAAISAAGEPCGRAWLDVHRYIWKASQELGYYSIAGTVVSLLQSLLKDLPELRNWTLSDDTPTANPETQRWLDQDVIPPEPEPAVVEDNVAETAALVAPPPVYQMDSDESREDRAPDVFELASQLMSQGHVEQAIQLLVRDSAQQPSGRLRFQRKMQVAQLCLAAGRANVAYPMLQQLVEEIEKRNLEEWESGELLAQPLALFLKCMDSSNNDEARREAIFSRLCRIDPTAAIDVSR
jgi:type VI secretion system protein ImpA